MGDRQVAVIVGVGSGLGFALVNVLQGVLLIVWVVATMFSKSVSFSLVSLIPLPFMFIATRWAACRSCPLRLLRPGM